MNFRQSYREATVQGVSPVGLVIRLYEQMIEDLRHAAKAIANNDIGKRTRHLKHAILVVGHLQSPLDFANGGKVARDLDHFYNFLRQNLLQVQFQPSKRGIAQMITDLLLVREAWIEVDRAENPLATSAPAASAPGATPSYGDDGDSGSAHMNCQG